MSAKSKIITTVFTDRGSGRVLRVRTSARRIFGFENRDFNACEIAFPGKFPSVSGFGWTYDPINGLKETAPPEGIELERLNFIKAKLDVAILLRARLALLELELDRAYAGKTVAKYPVSRKNFFTLWRFVREERAILKKRFRRLFAEALQELEECPNHQHLKKIARAQNMISIGLISNSNPQGIAHAGASD